MAIDLQNYSSELREMVENYYYNRIGFDEYRQLRNKLFNEIDEVLNVSVMTDTENGDRCSDGKIINRILNLLKKDKDEIVSD